jgi:TMEM175 potassium channel family protein
MDRGRLEAFSDGVFAVAITLLALNLAIGGPGRGPLLDQLGQHWPAFVAYVISFFTIGIIWVNHHTLVKNVRVVDRTLLFLNLLLLFFVVVIPFATATMAEYLTSAGQDAHIAMALYALVFEGMSLAFCAIFAWTLGEGRTHRPIPRETRGRAWLRFGIGLLFYLVATGVAFVNAPAALAIIGLVAVYYIVDPTPAALRRVESAL